MSTSSSSGEIFAERLAEVRQLRRLNQSELARKAGLQPSAIAHFEGKRRKPSFANILALANALGVSSDYLIGNADNIEGATTAFRNEEKLTSDDRDFIQSIINARIQESGKE